VLAGDPWERILCMLASFGIPDMQDHILAHLSKTIKNETTFYLIVGVSCDNFFWADNE